MTREDKQQLREALNSINNVAKRNGNKNPLRNFAYREWGIIDVLQKHYPTLTNSTCNKCDACDDSVGDWEFKSTTAQLQASGNIKSKGSFELDKMDEEAKLPEVRAINGWAFGIFEGVAYDPTFVLVLDSPELTNKLVEALVVPKQKEVIQKAKQARLAGKRIARDSVQLKLKELVALFGNQLKLFDSKSNRVNLDQFLDKVSI